MFEYETKLVAFIDVLGFKALVERDKKFRLEQYFEYITNDLKEYSKKGKGKIDYILISDAIVLLVDFTEIWLQQLIQIVSVIQAKLLTLKIPLRGAISFGDIYLNQDDNIIVGSGLINAYLLEEKAIYPRVIFDRKLMKYSDMKSVLNRERNLSWINVSEYKDSLDGFIYIDYLKVLARYDSLHKGNRLYSVYELILDNIHSNHHFEKYKWILSKWIEALEVHIEALAGKLDVIKDKQKANKKLRINREILEKLRKI